MALTLTPTSDTTQRYGRHVIGDLVMKLITITWDNSYPTGGEAIAPADVGLNQILAVIPTHGTLGSRIYAWDPVNSKLMMFTALGTEAGNGTDQSTISTPVIFIGK